MVELLKTQRQIDEKYYILVLEKLKNGTILIDTEIIVDSNPKFCLADDGSFFINYDKPYLSLYEKDEKTDKIDAVPTTKFDLGFDSITGIELNKDNDFIMIYEKNNCRIIPFDVEKNEFTGFKYKIEDPDGYIISAMISPDNSMMITHNVESALKVWKLTPDQSEFIVAQEFETQF